MKTPDNPSFFKKYLTYKTVQEAVGVVGTIPPFVSGGIAAMVWVEGGINSDLIKNHLSVILLINFFVLLLETVLVLAIFNSYRRHRINSISLEKYRRCEKEFGILSNENAKFDKAFFDSLYSKVIRKQISIEVSRREALREIDNNVISILNSASDIMRHVSGHYCAACVKLVFWADESSGDLKNVRIKTMLRDRASESRRAKREHVYTIDDNTANIVVIKSNGVNSFFSNDLKNHHGYHNSSSDWNEYYNAAIVVGIPNLNQNDNVLKVRGLLCVDNMEGDFDETVCTNYMDELAWRLSVLLYRERVLNLPKTGTQRGSA